MTITLDLTPEEEIHLREAAAAEGTDAVGYIRRRVFATSANTPQPEKSTAERLQQVDGNVDPNGQKYSVRTALEALGQLRREGTTQTDAQWETFKRGIDAARPGQRSIFGEGYNLPTTDETPA